MYKLCPKYRHDRYDAFVSFVFLFFFGFLSVVAGGVVAGGGTLRWPVAADVAGGGDDFA